MNLFAVQLDAPKLRLPEAQQLAWYRFVQNAWRPQLAAEVR